MKISRAMIGAVAGVLLVGVIGGAALLYAKPGLFDKAAEPAPPARSELARFATGSIARLETPAALETAPAYVFKTREGADARLSDFRGKVVVVNLWAMWCAPCRTEMPTLARLAELYEGTDLIVLPINVDKSEDELADARSFIDVHEPLPLYSDMKFQLPFELPGRGKMPQTVLLDRQGRIRAHFSGEADWSSPEARALIDALLAEPVA
ncbi:TlpA family protein disulfide reductase [Roseibacterium beibuensis]|uniref:TlpA family protein disulfide reductase n=1 Tax=[Roseibacterium] beibuensis TaxID=1193142 RepID=UPI00217D0D71|nr:TlpA disulfide reductase family protein [Roseibacterium beibuensis]MCS6626204.1 TlpA family protein disulfide reductase [Roseibacterium beibuensis]